MNSSAQRRRQPGAEAVLLLCLLACAAGSARAASAASAPGAPEIVAARGAPSALSPEYGPAVPIGDPSGDGLVLIPTGAGVEIRDTALPGAPLVGSFRTPGPVDHAAVSGATAFLFAGERGIVALDLSDPASPAAIASRAGLGRVARGAAVLGGGLLAASDSTLHFLRYDVAGTMTALRSVTFGDGRRIVAAAARSDSFLVASLRPGLIPRVILTLYRLQTGAALPESLAELAVNGHEAYDVGWNGTVAFVADGNQGVLVVDLAAQAVVRTTPVQGGRFVRSLDVNDTSVVAVAVGRALSRFRRLGAAGDSLFEFGVDALALEPLHVRLRGDLALAATYEQIAVVEPDEVGRSALEFARLSGAAAPAPIGGSGRARRVAHDAGLAYVADYTGGLRIYRAAGADTSLVGVLPVGGTDRVFDVALDPARGLAFLAAGTGGLFVADVSDPAAPALLAAVPLPGIAVAVARAGGSLVAVARRGSGAGVTFVDAAVAGAPVARGSVNSPFVQDPRAVAARDTVLFVADEALGVFSIGFGNPDAPAAFGAASGDGARDLDVTGGTMLVATRTRGLQVVDVNAPASPILRAEVLSPPAFGVARSGGSAALFLGEEGVLAVDVQAPSAPVIRGPIGVPGFARDGAWTGDTLTVAAGLGLERFIASASAAVPALSISLDLAGSLPRARISWTAISEPGLVGLNLYRDLGASGTAGTDPDGRRINPELLPPGATEAVDDSLTAGAVHRYRLEAFLADGQSRKVAEGSIAVPATRSVGLPFPNPFRPAAGEAILPYRAVPGAAGRILVLRIYDIAGRLVRTARTTASATGGFGQMRWDGRDERGRRAPDGIYFLHLEGAGIDDSRSLTLLR